LSAELLTPQSTLVVVLGADDWQAAGLESSEAFGNSARAVLDYFGPDYRGYPADNILNLFNDPRDASAQVTAIRRFLRSRIIQHGDEKAGITDIVIFYTGHGAFHQTNNEYFLLVRNSEAGLEYTTGLQIRFLADCLSQYAFLRKFIILDCCFAAAAGAIFQSDAAQIVATQAAEALPRRGTVLLCSSSSRVTSRIEHGQPYTMFCQALKEVLFSGSKSPRRPNG